MWGASNLGPCNRSTLAGAEDIVLQGRDHDEVVLGEH